MVKGIALGTMLMVAGGFFFGEMGSAQALGMRNDVIDPCTPKSIGAGSIGTWNGWDGSLKRNGGPTWNAGSYGCYEAPPHLSLPPASQPRAGLVKPHHHHHRRHAHRGQA
jgi:hypothetical protein